MYVDTSDYSRKKVFIRYSVFTIQTLQSFWTRGSVWLHIHCSTSIFCSEHNFQFTKKLIVESSLDFTATVLEDKRAGLSNCFQASRFPVLALPVAYAKAGKDRFSQMKTNCSENHIHICGISGPRPPLFL